MVFQFLQHVLKRLPEYEMNIEWRLSKGDLPNEHSLMKAKTSTTLTIPIFFRHDDKAAKINL